MVVAVEGDASTVREGVHFLQSGCLTVLQRTLTSRDCELDHLAPVRKKGVEHPCQESLPLHSLQHLRNLRH